MRFARLAFPTPSHSRAVFAVLSAVVGIFALSFGPAGCGTTQTSDPVVQPDAGTEQDAGLQCTDNEACGQMEFCNGAHQCEACTVATEIPECEEGLVADYDFGNGCHGKTCCPFGTQIDPATQTCFGFATLDLTSCPWQRSFECYIRFWDITDDPSMPLGTMTTPADTNEVGAFAVMNGGKGTLHISHMGLTPESSPDFHMVTAPRTELAGGETMVVQFAYTPDGHNADRGEFVIESDAMNGAILSIPVIGDTYWTECTDETVKQTCIQGQFCDEELLPATCADCPQPLDPMCSHGSTIPVEPEGSNACVEFYCQCGSGDVYVQGRGCQQIRPCDASCTDCRHLCKRFPAKYCSEDDMVDHCMSNP